MNEVERAICVKVLKEMQAGEREYGDAEIMEGIIGAPEPQGMIDMREETKCATKSGSLVYVCRCLAYALLFAVMGYVVIQATRSITVSAEKVQAANEEWNEQAEIPRLDESSWPEPIDAEEAVDELKKETIVMEGREGRAVVITIEEVLR